MIKDLFKNLWRTIRRHPIALILQSFVAFSIGWTVTEAAFHFADGKAPFLKEMIWLYSIGIVSLIWALYSKWQVARVLIPLKQSNVTVEVSFGDIFRFDGITAIPVGEFFDSELGLPVSPNSLHGVFINKCFGGHPQAFDQQVDRALSGLRATHIDKKHGKTARYPIGTTASISVASEQYLAFALTHADPKTCKASADVPQMFQALAGLWKEGRTHMSGNALNLPLVGSGLSGIGLPPTDLIYIILLSFQDESRRQIITEKLRIILTWDRIDQVDLRKLKKDWEQK